MKQENRKKVWKKQREELLAFMNWYKDDLKEKSNNETIVDAYLDETKP